MRLVFDLTCNHIPEVFPRRKCIAEYGLFAYFILLQSIHTFMKFKKILVLTAMASLLAACSKNSPTGTTPDTTAKTPTPPPDTALAIAVWGTISQDTNPSAFAPAVEVARITNDAVSSASGIGASRFYPGMFWIENDQGGGTPYIWLFDTTGTNRAVFKVTGASNRDWTDMSVAPGPIAGTTYIYLADIGDSKADNTTSFIYRFPEPQNPLDSGVLSAVTTMADKITFKYPNGPRDAETILVDPQSMDIYIVDKGAAGNLYELPYPQSTDTVITAKWLLSNMVLGDSRSGGIASDRSFMMLKSYQQCYLWKISPGESILNAFLATPVTEPFNAILEPQGEAMCLTPNDSAYWTTSKFDNLTYESLDRYSRK